MDTKRGRIAYKAYTQAISQMLGRDGYAMNQCEILIQFERVEELVKENPHLFYSKGFAARFLLDKAIAHVIKVMRANGDPQSLRIADFLEQRKAKTIAKIAREWGLTRECVSRTINRQAVDLVTKRYLALVRIREAERESSQQKQNTEKRSA